MSSGRSSLSTSSVRTTRIRIQSINNSNDNNRQLSIVRKLATVGPSQPSKDNEDDLEVPFELEENDIFAFALSAKRFCRVKTYKGKVYVDVREYFEDDEDKWSPSKKGLMITIKEWEKLKKHVQEIDKAISMAEKEL